MKLELDRVFLRRSNVPLDLEDLRLGLSLGLISPPTTVALAAEALNHGSPDPVILELALLDGTAVADIRCLLHATDPEDADLNPAQSARKWAYLELKAAYEIRDRLRDPLGAVEQIYADFDYPPAVASFVRYMPPPPDADSSEAALYERWRQYLAAEAAALNPSESGKQSCYAGI
jgi:hypothetical protein